MQGVRRPDTAVPGRARAPAGARPAPPGGGGRRDGARARGGAGDVPLARRRAGRGGPGGRHPRLSRGVAYLRRGERRQRQERPAADAGRGAAPVRRDAPPAGGRRRRLRPAGEWQCRALRAIELERRPCRRG